MIRWKIQRFEVVVISLDDRPFSDRIAEVLEHPNNFVLRANDRMFGANGATDAGKGNVDCRIADRRCRLRERRLNLGFDFRFESVYTLANFALRFFRSRLEPEVIDLREDSIFAAEPSITESFVLGLAVNICG